MGCNCGSRNRTKFPPPAGLGGKTTTPTTQPAGMLDPATNQPRKLSRAGTLRSQTFALGGEPGWPGR